MHDPNTVAFEIKYPWFHTLQMGKTRYRYWPSFITIWHVDPERCGSDDSCGWFRPPFTEVQREIVKTLASDEARDPWFMSLSAKQNSNPVECESYVRGAFLLVSSCLENRCGWRPWRQRKRSVTLDEATRWAALMTHQSDNFRSSLAFLSGYHSNWYRDGEPNTIGEDKYFREQQASGFFGAIMGYILRERRPWYRKPRWHLIHWKMRVIGLGSYKLVRKCLSCEWCNGTGWKGETPRGDKLYCELCGGPNCVVQEEHTIRVPLPIVGWKIQIHPLQSLKRWAFSRCCRCGGRFAWGYSPVSDSWNGTGPLWFRSEQYTYHADCSNPTSNCCMAAEKPAEPVEP